MMKTMKSSLEKFLTRVRIAVGTNLLVMVLVSLVGGGEHGWIGVVIAMVIGLTLATIEG